MLSNRKSMLAPPALGGEPRQRASSFGPGAPPPSFAAAMHNTEAEPHCGSAAVPTATTATLPGYRVVRVVGAVYGSTTCARKDTKSLLRAAFGHEAKSLTHMLYRARDQAVDRMARDAVARGANAVVGLAFGESELLGFAQVSVYGTAVYVEKE